MNIEEYSKFKQFFKDEIPNLLMQEISRKNWNTYLDLGCGDGSLLNAINKRGYFSGKKVFAVDLSKNRIELVKKINKNFICIVGDACNVKELEKGSIDLLVSEQVVEHVLNDEDMVREISRLLKTGGVVYLSTIFKKWYGWYFYRCNDKWTLDPTHLREYTNENQLFDYFKKYGLEIKKNKKILAKRPLIDFILKRLNFDRDVYENYFLRALRFIKLPILGYYKWEIVCKKI